MDKDRHVLRLPAVMKCTGLSKPSIYRLIDANEFPTAIRFGCIAVGWPSDRIDEWIDSRESHAADAVKVRQHGRR